MTSRMVSTAWLAQHLADPDIRIFEVCSLNNDKVYPGRVVVLLEDDLLARNRPRLHLASGHGEAVRRPGHRTEDNRPDLWRSRLIWQLRVLDLHNGRAPKAQAARRRAQEMARRRPAAL